MKFTAILLCLVVVLCKASNMDDEHRESFEVGFRLEHNEALSMIIYYIIKIDVPSHTLFLDIQKDGSGSIQ